MVENKQAYPKTEKLMRKLTQFFRGLFVIQNTGEDKTTSWRMKVGSQFSGVLATTLCSVFHIISPHPGEVHWPGKKPPWPVIAKHLTELNGLYKKYSNLICGW